jgi:glycosyltransferase involved in cell wall biosynthesis
MKIIALLPVKNEEWVLPTYISSMKKIADEIIVLDDNSTDRTREILDKNKVIVIKTDNVDKVNMSQKRKILLEEGRKRGGTHFIWLDADESFDSNFLANGRNIINNLLPGQKISLPWITLWKSIDEERVDGVWKNNFKDVIVYDIPEYSFKNLELSETRTQGPNDKIIKIDRYTGVILHFQFINFRDAQTKQAWYRCIELIQTKKDPRRINNTYSVGLDNNKIILKKTNSEWFTGISIPQQESNKWMWYIDNISKMFNEYGIKYFEPLDIWYVKELEDEFIKKIGRVPKSKKFPKWLIKLNNIKNKLRTMK